MMPRKKCREYERERERDKEREIRRRRRRRRFVARNKCRENDYVNSAIVVNIVARTKALYQR